MTKLCKYESEPNHIPLMVPSIKSHEARLLRPWLPIKNTHLQVHTQQRVTTWGGGGFTLLLQLLWTTESAYGSAEPSSKYSYYDHISFFKNEHTTVAFWSLILLYLIMEGVVSAEDTRASSTGTSWRRGLPTTSSRATVHIHHTAMYTV